MQGVQEEVVVDYDWEPKPCIVCSSFAHEHGSCGTMATMLASTEDTAQNMTRPTASLVGEEIVETPAFPLVLEEPEVI